MTAKIKNGGFSWGTFVQKIVYMEVICKDQGEEISVHIL